MFWIGLTVLVALFWALWLRSRLNSSEEPASADLHDGREQAMKVRDGQLIAVDSAFEAWTSSDLELMQGALATQTHPVDRHFLLQGIVTATYRRRSEPEMRRLCRTVAEIHLAELPEIAPHLASAVGGFLPRITTFQYYATVLTEDGDFDRAIEVCDTAIGLALHDRTKGGFLARKARIEKRRTAAN